MTHGPCQRDNLPLSFAASLQRTFAASLDAILMKDAQVAVIAIVFVREASIAGSSLAEFCRVSPIPAEIPRVIASFCRSVLNIVESW